MHRGHGSPKRPRPDQPIARTGYGGRSAAAPKVATPKGLIKAFAPRMVAQKSLLFGEVDAAWSLKIILFEAQNLYTIHLLLVIRFTPSGSEIAGVVGLYGSFGTRRPVTFHGQKTINK